MTGGEGKGMTHAKFVPAPVNRVSMTRRSRPLVKWIKARWSGIRTSAGTAVACMTMPSAHTEGVVNSNASNAKKRFT